MYVPKYFYLNKTENDELIIKLSLSFLEKKKKRKMKVQFLMTKFLNGEVPCSMPKVSMTKFLDGEVPCSMPKACFGSTAR